MLDIPNHLSTYLLMHALFCVWPHYLRALTGSKNSNMMVMSNPDQTNLAKNGATPYLLTHFGTYLNTHRPLCPASLAVTCYASNVLRCCLEAHWKILEGHRGTFALNDPIFGHDLRLSVQFSEGHFLVPLCLVRLSRTLAPNCLLHPQIL